MDAHEIDDLVRRYHEKFKGDSGDELVAQVEQGAARVTASLWVATMYECEPDHTDPERTTQRKDAVRKAAAKAADPRITVEDSISNNQVLDVTAPPALLAGFLEMDEVKGVSDVRPPTRPRSMDRRERRRHE